MFTIKMKIGQSELTYQATDMKGIHKFMSVYGALPIRCDCCNGANLYLSHKNPKGNDYYMITCKDCNASLNLGQKKEGGFFVKTGEKMSVYVPDANSQIDHSQMPSQAVNNVNQVFNGPSAEQNPFNEGF